MLMPSVFGENLFDDLFGSFPFYDDKAEKKLEKKLYGRRGQNLLISKRLLRDTSWWWMCLDLRKTKLKWPWRMAI